ncbi:MAG: GNAT family N-acetyltransferase [Pseudonocardia sp.]|nr:GNAT family N-acetyltransferase [Pseudonocardia sp.]
MTTERSTHTGSIGHDHSDGIGTLMTARLVLCPYACIDVPMFLELALDPQVTHLVGDGIAWSRERATERFRTGRAAHRDGTGVWLKILDRETHAHLGVLTAHLGSGPGREVEVGVWITPPRWATGIAREALRAVLPVLRRRFPHSAIVAEARIDHVASDRLLRAVGFQDHGRRTGRYGNTARYYTWRGPVEPSRTPDDLPG